MSRRIAWVIAIAIGAVVFLTACGPSAQQSNEGAQTFCKLHKGVDHVEYDASNWPFPSYYNVTCRDGSIIE